MSHLRIGQRLALGFAIVIALMVVLTAIGIERVLRIDQGHDQPGQQRQAALRDQLPRQRA